MAEISKKKIWIWAIVISVVLVGTGLGVGIPLYNYIKNRPDLPEYQNVTVQEAKTMIDDDVTYPNLIILDVRTLSEYESGHLINATLLTWNSVNWSFDGGESVLVGNESTNILVYCNSGTRSARASQFLLDAGFTQIFNMWGGIQAWNTAGYPTTT